MRAWFTSERAPLLQRPLKRFDPLHWTVDFPRGTIASVRKGSDAKSLIVDAEFLRSGDLVGLIWESEDRHAHRAHARETKRDYAGTRLSFRWQSSGIIGLDSVNGPTLTIEGRDANGDARAWYVRLWNYAVGTPSDAVVTLDFDALEGGFALPADADPVDPHDIDRMFISLVPPDYVGGGSDIRSAPAVGSVTMSDISCSGSGSVINIADSWQPQQPLGIATGYDDQYHLVPERLIETIERLGYEGSIILYVGMSHYMALGDDGRVNASRGMNGPARAWHEAFASAAAAAGKSVIFSLSYEIFDAFCPDSWRQRDFGGGPALTGYVPPSTLVSPAHAGAIGYLADIAAELVDIAEAAGLDARFQVGEPWWWVQADGRPCFYDDAAKAALGGNPPEISALSGALDAAQLQLLDDAGSLLAASTATIAASAKAAGTGVETLLLPYLPTVMDPAASEARRANLPLGWAAPAFDRLQIEDYEWVTNGRPKSLREADFADVDARLGYPVSEQHYLAGFASDAAAPQPQWKRILDAASASQARGVAETFVWALPQVMRDGLVIMGQGEEEVEAFADVEFPIAIGADASAAPAFSTQVVTSASGFEFRNANWNQARLRFDAGPGVRGDEELETLLKFFRARRGPAQAFRFRDPFDHSSNGMTAVPGPDDQQIGVGDGIAQTFQLSKSYADDGEQREITRPVSGSVRVAIDGNEMSSGWTLGSVGAIHFDTAPASGAVVTAGFLFDVPVRFAEDRIEVNRASFLAGEAPSVPLIEVREDAA